MEEEIEEMIDKYYKTLDIRIYKLDFYRIQIYFKTSFKIDFEIQIDNRYTKDYNMIMIRNRIDNLILENFKRKDI